jgi:cytochrome P450
MSRSLGDELTTFMNFTRSMVRIKRGFYQCIRLIVPQGKVVRVSPHEVDFSSSTGAKRIHAFVRPFPKAKMYDAFLKEGGALDVFSTRNFDVHSQHRRLLSTGLSESWLKKSEHVLRERVALAVERIGQEMKEHGAADVMKWWLFFATDVIGELTFGDSFRMLEQGKVRFFFERERRNVYLPIWHALIHNL